MSSTSDFAQDFVIKLTQGVPLQEALAPALLGEAELRRKFANDRSNSILDNPFAGTLDVFASNQIIRLIEAREIQDETAKDAKHIFPLKSHVRKPSNAPAMAENINQFRTSWNIFTEGALSQLTDWNNVVAAGGAVLASLLPLPEHARASKRAIRKYFHEETTYSTSDIDLFLYGLTPEQAEKKAIQIYEAVCDSVPWDTVCVRTKHTISIHSQYPYRPIQIVLRLYKSPAEILAGFDIDCACFIYNGNSVWGNPRGVAALKAQANRVDMTRRSPSYEVRLAKYSSRGFEVSVPDLKREDVDPTIFERSINRIEGLARLLVLEKLSDPDDRTKYLERRRVLRGRPEPQGYSRRAMRRRRKVKGDLKAAAEMFGGVSASDYGTQSFHIPYGPGFDSKKVEKFIYGTDLGMNSTFNPKNKDRRLHRHPAFFGTMVEVMNDCCEYCPEPITTEEKELQAVEDAQYIRGRVEFMQEDPGRQMMTGSFHPIDEGEWSIQAYLGPVEKLFRAVGEGDLETVRDIVEGGFDLQRRDHVGRTALHLAIMAKSEALSSYLIESGARITARLVDGRTSLHLASQLGMTDVVSKLIDRSKQNEKKAEEDKAAAEAAKEKGKKDKDGDSEMGDNKSDKGDDEEMDPSSEDDWDSDGEPRKKKKAEPPAPATTINDPPAEGSAIPEDNEELPDILEINAIDWDFMYSPLSHAIVAGHIEVVDLLIKAGADVTTPFKKGPTYSQVTCYPLTLTLLTEDRQTACAIAERLLESGASCTAADDSLKTIFHQAVLAKNVELVKTFIRVDPNAKTAMDFLPQISYNEAANPLVSAIGLNERSIAALLVSSGASVKITPEMFDRSWDARYSVGNRGRWVPTKQEDQWIKETSFPVESALAQRSDLVIPMIQLGADLNLGLRMDNQYSQKSRRVRRTILDAIRESIKCAENNLKEYERLSDWQPQQKAQVTASRSLYQDWEESDDTLEGWMTGQVKKTALSRGLSIQRVQVNPTFFAGMTMPGGTVLTSMTTSGAPQDTTTPYKALIFAANAQLDWLREVEQIVTENGGKTAMELDPVEEPVYPSPPLWGGAKRLTQTTPKIEDATSLAPKKTVPLEYKIYRDHYQSSEPVAAHQKALYAQLFAACWKGDTKTIERLCLPPKSGKRDRHATYIQVAAEVFPSSGGMGCGYSTLAVAVLAKRWDTAKAIISIAKAQYQKTEEAPQPFQPFENSDGSDEEYDSEMSMDDYDEPVDKPRLVDLANRLSTVKTSVGPGRLFGVYYTMRGEEKDMRSGNPITYALEDADVQSVEQAVALGQMCDPPITIGEGHLGSVIKSDEPAMLDYFIRRYGFGISVQTDEEEHEPTSGDHGDVSNRKTKASKTYLGLNVQGRKRKDLAAKGDPDAPTMVAETPLPLIWQAAQLNAPKILTWLVTSAPLDAYKAYMKSSDDEAAVAMKRMPKFEQRFPDLIGSTVTDVGENVMLAHLSGGAPKLETIKLLFSLFPGLKTAFVYKKLEGLKITTLHYVCAMNLAPEIFDFFLEKAGVDTVITDRDYKGFNILHAVTSKNHLKLLKHIFTKLPRDQLALMLSQTTYGDQNTPLMLAIKATSTSAVEFLLAFDHPVTNASLAARDSDGSLPLHIAVTKGYGEITKLLLGASPKSLFVEDGLGSTPLEQAEFRYMLWHSNNGLGHQNAAPLRWSQLSQVVRLENAEIDALFSSSWIRQLFNSIPEYGGITPSEVQDLDATVQYLDREGRFVQQPAVKRVLDEYVKRCYASATKWTAFEAVRKAVKDAEAKELVPVPMEAETNKLDHQDVKATYEVVRGVVAASGTRTRRELVHLLDAQRAVDTALKAATKKGGNNGEEFHFPGEYYRRYRRRTYGNQPGDDGLDLTSEKKENKVFRYSLDLGGAADGC